MITIILKTIINAPVERCFDLSTSIDLHKISTSKTKEEAIDGVTEGLIKANESVTWRAKHFGIWHTMKVRITRYEKPKYFVDEMVAGRFKKMKHKHEFKPFGNGTLMVDTFQFSSPFGILGRIVDYLVLEKYMTDLLTERNKVIKEFAESDILLSKYPFLSSIVGNQNIKECEK